MGIYITLFLYRTAVYVSEYSIAVSSSGWKGVFTPPSKGALSAVKGDVFDSMDSNWRQATLKMPHIFLDWILPSDQLSHVNYQTFEQLISL